MLQKLYTSIISLITKSGVLILCIEYLMCLKITIPNLVSPEL